MFYFTVRYIGGISFFTDGRAFFLPAAVIWQTVQKSVLIFGTGYAFNLCQQAGSVPCDVPQAQLDGQPVRETERGLKNAKSLPGFPSKKDAGEAFTNRRPDGGLHGRGKKSGTQ